MATKKAGRPPLPTTWHASDELWAGVEQVPAEYGPPAKFGPDRIGRRAAFDGVIFRMRGGLRWGRLPPVYGDDSSVRRTFRRWLARGVPHRLWGVMVKDCEELGGVDWRWHCTDADSPGSPTTLRGARRGRLAVAGRRPRDGQGPARGGPGRTEPNGSGEAGGRSAGC